MAYKMKTISQILDLLNLLEYYYDQKILVD